MEINILMKIIPKANRWIEIIHVDKGWSNEYKYKVIDKTKNEFLLRIAEIDKFNKKIIEFNVLNKLSSKTLNIPIPLEIGTSLDNKFVYTVSNWIKGEDTVEVIRKFPVKKQYSLGIEAGVILKEIHNVSIDVPQVSWNDLYLHKINQKIELMHNCSIQLEHQEFYLACINQNKYLLKDRPLTFQHGDFHIGNTLINENTLYLIDFNRHDIGDPWEEFNRISFSAEISHAFATGCIDGYFNHQIPADFFPLLALYTSVNQIGSIPWAINYGNDEINTMKRLSNLILDSYDNFSTYLPKWYLTDIHELNIYLEK